MTFHWGTFLFEAINFVVLAYILHRLLYRPLHQAIDERRQANEKVRADAEHARREAVALQEQLQAQLASLEQQRQKTMSDARELAAVDRKKLLAEAEQQVQRRQEDVHQELAREREELARTSQAELVGVAIDLAERLLRESCDSTLNQQLARRLAESLADLPDKERQQLREHWQRDDGAVVESALELDAGALRTINQALATVINQPVDLAVQTRPALLGGVRLRVGGQVWDASLAGQLEAARLPRGKACGHD